MLRGELHAPARVGRREVAPLPLHGRVRGQVEAGQQRQQLRVQTVQHVAQELVGVLLLVTSAMILLNITCIHFVDLHVTNSSLHCSS